MYIKVPTITPYPHQYRVFKAVLEGKNAVLIIHRRAGKDICCLQLWLLRALQRIGTHVYLFPLYSQARSVIWEGMDFSGKPFISAIPESLIANKNQARMTIDLVNGSKLVLAGSNNYDSLMGTNPVTLIYSEFAMHHPLARQYLNPILVQNKGLEIVQSTPRGKNHLYELYQSVKDHPNYHIEHLSVDETFKYDGSRIITPEDIEESKRMGMSDETIRQEWFCDFNVGNVGSYFTKETSDMEREGRICRLEPIKGVPLHTCSDLGGTDSTAMWLFQVVGEYIHLLHLIHDSGKGLKHYLELAEKIREQHGLRWGNHFAPHDVTQKHQGFEHAESRLMQARKAGWNFLVTPKMDIEDGIEAMRFIFPKLKVDKVNCDLGVRAMREYRREYDEDNAVFKQKPLHNWASNPMDALRYLAINYRRLYSIPHSQTSYKYEP